MPEPKKDLFSDLSLTFTAHPVTGELARKKNREAVKQSVKSLILTDFYERPFKPNIGCSIRNSLFELFTPITQQTMENAVRDVIANYEPRADVVDVIVEATPDDHFLAVSVVFYIKNDPNPVDLDIILERVR
jgi:phage baseplate assembly protein W